MPADDEETDEQEEEQQVINMHIDHKLHSLRLTACLIKLIYRALLVLVTSARSAGSSGAIVSGRHASFCVDIPGAEPTGDIPVAEPTGMLPGASMASRDQR